MDWTTQWWNLLLGKRVDGVSDRWLLGPIGMIGESADAFIRRLAQEESLVVRKNDNRAGLIQNFEDLNTSVHPQIQDFYTRTSEYQLESRTRWTPGFAQLGFWVSWLFSRRIQQLNLPQSTQDEVLAIQGDIISLINRDGEIAYSIWHRRYRHSGEVLFYGVYTIGRLPSGEPCIKTIFPLPAGNATVIFRITSDGPRNLTLTSAGKDYGDPGFYFMVEDSRGRLWKHHLATFHEKIQLHVDAAGGLSAQHSMALWGMKAYTMEYEIMRKGQNLSSSQDV